VGWYAPKRIDIERRLGASVRYDAQTTTFEFQANREDEVWQ
jgi:hypothetical protein